MSLQIYCVEITISDRIERVLALISSFSETKTIYFIIVNQNHFPY